MAAIVTTLSNHYYRERELTETQRALWLMGYIEDLDGKPVEIIEKACGFWRRDGKNRYVATPGQLLGIIRDIEPTVETKRYREFMPRTVYNRALVSREKQELNDDLALHTGWSKRFDGTWIKSMADGTTWVEDPNAQPIPRERVNDVIDVTNAKYGMKPRQSDDGEEYAGPKTSPSKTLDEIKAGNLWDSLL